MRIAKLGPLVVAFGTSASVATLALTGCELFESPSCKQGEMRCSGKRVQTCVADVAATSSQGRPAFRWNTDETCKDDEQLGHFTCGEVLGKATCVARGFSDDSSLEDAGSATAPFWLRAGIARDGNGYRISEVASYSPDAAPFDPAWGVVAAVAYRGDVVVDATLVPLEPTASETFAWLRGEQVDHIVLMAADGTTLSEAREGMSSTSASDKSVLGVSKSALVEGLPSTLKVMAQGRGYGASVPPTASMEQLLSRVLAPVPPSLLMMISEVVLRVDKDGDGTTEAAAALPASSAAAAGSSDAVDPLAGGRRVSRSQVALGQLWIDFTQAALVEYAQSTNGVSFDIISELGKAYGRASQAVTAQHVFESLGVKLPADFPMSVQVFLTDQLAPLLQAGETPYSAWELLHEVAVTAGLAPPYPLAVGVAGSLTSGATASTDAAAVQQGFASTDGALSADADLLSYLARANVLDFWEASPCSGIQALPLDKLAPSLLVPVAKLLALEGLGLLSSEKREQCTGVLRASTGADTIALHKPDGTRIVFADGLEGIRQPYFGTEMQLNWKAERSYLSLSLTLQYRGAMPTVMRISPVASHSSVGGDATGYSAVFASTNPDGYQTAIAKGGLAVITRVQPSALEAFALMVTLDQPLGGTKVLPLVSAQISNPTWGEAP